MSAKRHSGTCCWAVLSGPLTPDSLFPLGQHVGQGSLPPPTFLQNCQHRGQCCPPSGALPWPSREVAPVTSGRLLTPSQPHGACQPGSLDPFSGAPHLLGQAPGRNFPPGHILGFPAVTCCSSKGRTIRWEFCVRSSHAISSRAELGGRG